MLRARRSAPAPVRVGAGVPALVLALALSGCSDDGAGSASPGTAVVDGSAGSTERSGAEVAAGLAAVIAGMTTMSEAPSTATPDAIAALAARWRVEEPTVASTDPALHLALERALDEFAAAARRNDHAGLAASLAAFSTAASAYLTAHPG